MGNGFMSNLLVMFGFQVEYLRIGVPTGMDDGSGSPCAVGPGSPMSHGVGQPFTSEDGIGARDSAGTGYRLPYGDLAGSTGIGDTTISAGYLSATGDIPELWSTTSTMEIAEENIILTDPVPSLLFTRISLEPETSPRSLSVRRQ